MNQMLLLGVATTLTALAGSVAVVVQGKEVGRCDSVVTRDGLYARVTAVLSEGPDAKVTVHAVVRRRVPLKQGSPLDDVFPDEIMHGPTPAVFLLSLRSGTTDAPRVVSSTPGGKTASSLTMAPPSGAPESWNASVATSMGTHACRLEIKPDRSTSGR